MSFFLVSTTKLFLSHEDGFNGSDVKFQSHLLGDQLWYEDENGYIGAHNTDLMLVDHHDQPSLVSKDDFHNLPQGKTRLEKVGPQQYVVHGAHYIKDNIEGQAESQAESQAAVFRKVYAREFLGCIHWSGAAYHTTGNPSFVREGLQAIEQLGFGIVKVKLNQPRGNYRGRVPDHVPSSIRSTIENVFDDNFEPFHTIIFSVWSTNEWSHLNPPEENKHDRYFLDIEGDELEDQLMEESLFFLNLTQYLENRFENKTIVLQNRESDRIFADILDNQAQMQKVIRWMRARQTGISRGRKSPPLAGNSTKVLHAIEVNNVEERLDNSFCTKVLPNIGVDLVSYSMHERHEQGFLFTSLDYIEGLMKPPSRYMEQLARIDERFSRRVYLGEYGKGDLDHSDNLRLHATYNQDILVNAISWGCPFALYWQIFENEWRYEDGQNPGRGLYLPNDADDVHEFPEPLTPVTVQKTQTAKWLSLLLNTRTSVVSCKNKEQGLCGNTEGCQFYNNDCIPDIPHTIQNQSKGFRNEVARTFRAVLGPLLGVAHEQTGYRHDKYQGLYGDYNNEALINRQNRNAWLKLQLKKNTGGNVVWNNARDYDVYNFLDTSKCIVCMETTGERFHTMRCCGNPIHQSCLQNWHDSHAQNSAYHMQLVFANVYGDGSQRPRVNQYCEVKCLHCQRNLDLFRQPPIVGIAANPIALDDDGDL